MRSQAAVSVQWYVMLFPQEQEEHSIMREMADLVGGRANPEPHVTLGYFAPTDPDADLATPLRGLSGPVVPIRAGEPFNALHRPETPTLSRNILLKSDRANRPFTT